MPLMEGDFPRAIAHNIRVEMEAGKPYKQALAIALKEADKSKGKKKKKK